jgi:hypothetical protein
MKKEPMTEEQRARIREQWRKWAQAKRDRMTPEELIEERNKARTRKLSQRSTPEGAARHKEQCRRWRENNPDKVAHMRENEKMRKRIKAAALRAERENDPEYFKAQELKKEKAKEKTRSACARYRERRKKRFTEDAAFSEHYKNKQKQYRLNAKARLMQDPEWQAKMAERAARAAERVPRAKGPLSEKEREERARRRREEKVKAQRLLNALKRAEEKKLEKKQEIAAKKAEPPTKPKMGRFTALSRWYGY